MDKVTCVDGHEMLKGKKFCGACGKGPADAQNEMQKCGACSGEFMKGANFCMDCGEPTTADLDRALSTLGEFQKANAAKLEDFSKLPELDEEAIVAEIDAGASEIVKSAAIRDAKGDIVHDAAGLPEINAMPVVQELFKGQALASAQARKFFDHVTGFLGHIAHGQELLMKANLAIGAELQRYRGESEAAANASRGPKGIVRPLLAPAKLGPAPVGGASAGDSDEARGPALMLKAQAVLGKALAPLETAEVALFETYTHGQNMSLSEIAAVRPRLAERVQSAIAAKQGASAAS